MIHAYPYLFYERTWRCNSLPIINSRFVLYKKHAPSDRTTYLWYVSRVVTILKEKSSCKLLVTLVFVFFQEKEREIPRVLSRVQFTGSTMYLPANLRGTLWSRFASRHKHTARFVLGASRPFDRMPNGNTGHKTQTIERISYVKSLFCA